MAHGRWIKAARTARSLTQARLGELVGVSQAQVSQGETGRLEPRAEQLTALKAILGEPAETETRVELSIPLGPAAMDTSAIDEPAPGPTGEPGRPAPPRTRPTRRLTQAELDTFLEKAADTLRGGVDHSEFRGYVFAEMNHSRRFWAHVCPEYRELDGELREMWKAVPRWAG